MIDIVKNLIAPPRCAGCGERLDIFDGSCDKAFCDTCRSKWEKTKRMVCFGCKLENVECICEGKMLKGTRILSLIKFGKEISCDRLIYALKRRKNKRLFDFAADELYKRLLAESPLITSRLSDTIFTNVPRNIRSKNEFGFDHAQLLAMELAERSGGEYRKLILRRLGGRAQKKLGVEERRKNVNDRFAFNDKENISGKTVILVDDVLTTGATASECIKTLRDNGAAETVLAVIARAEKSKGKNNKQKGKNNGAV